MKNASFKLAAVAVVVASAFASQAYAAGFQLSEQSTVQMGRAMAGAGVVGDDLSAVHYNPAGMTLLPGTRIQATGTWVAVNLEYEGDNGSTENGRKKGQMIPAGFITHQLNDQWWIGLGLTVPYGMGTDYDRNWSGADRGNKSTILTFDMNPNVAWKMNEKLSFGAGLSLQYAKAELGMGAVNIPNFGYLANANVEGDSWSWGWNVGMMWTPVETLRVGLSYRSHITHDAEGDTTLEVTDKLKDMPLPESMAALKAFSGATLKSDMEVRIKTPDTVTLSAAWDATEQLTLSATARWSKWSNFKALNLKNKDFPNVNLAGINPQNLSVENNWDDTWFFSIGADYRLNNQWTVRGGVAYDQGPVENQYRMAVIPDTDRVWVAGGASYKHSKNFTIDFGAAWITGVGDTDLYSNNHGLGKDQKQGEFKSLDSYVFSTQMQYRF